MPVQNRLKTGGNDVLLRVSVSVSRFRLPLFKRRFGRAAGRAGGQTGRRKAAAEKEGRVESQARRAVPQPADGLPARRRPGPHGQHGQVSALQPHVRGSAGGTAHPGVRRKDAGRGGPSEEQGEAVSRWDATPLSLFFLLSNSLLSRYRKREKRRRITLFFFFVYINNTIKIDHITARPPLV